MAEEEPDVQLCEESPDESANQAQGKQRNILLTFYSDHNMYKKQSQFLKYICILLTAKKKTQFGLWTLLSIKIH